MPKKKPGKQKTGGWSLSIPGMLAILVGLTIFYLYWTLRWSVHIQSLFSRVVLLGSALLVILWGVHEIVLGSVMNFRGRRSRRRTEDEFTRPPSSRRWAVLWGVCQIAGGLAFATLIALRAESSLTVVVGITVGILLVAGGLRKAAAALQKDAVREQSWPLRNITLPGIAYVVIMVAFMAGALIGRSNMLMLIFALMAGPFIINGGVALRQLTMITVRRKLPERAIAGDTVDISLTVENGKRLMSTAIVDVIDRIAGNGEELQTGVLFARIPARSSRSGTYQFRPMQRGRYRFGPTIVSSRYPLGLVERGIRFACPDELLVYPRLGRLTSQWERDTTIATELVETENARFGVYEDEFHRLREHRWGDNPRAIHWRTSARRNEMMVREYQQSRDRDLVVLLDLWTPTKPGDDFLERVELAISFAATICVEHMRFARESQVTVVAGGKKTQQWQGQAGAAAFDSLLSMLALLNPGSSLSPAELLAKAGAAHSPATRFILISTTSERLEPDASPPDAGATVGGQSGIEPYVADWQSIGRYFDPAFEARSRGGRI